MNKRNWMHCAAALVAASGLCVGATAQIIVGQTVGLTGAVAATVGEAVAGAKLYINAVNARGGVNKQQIELITLDDKFDVKLTAENARKLVVENNAVVLFLNRGTPHTEAMVPLLEEFKIALVAPSTGATSLHTPVNKYIFNVRSAYRLESEKAVSLLSSIGITSIGVLHVDDTFGADALVGLSAGFVNTAIKPLFIEKFDRVKPVFDALALRVRTTNPQAVIVVGSGTAVSDAVKAMRAAGSRAQLVTLSNNASSGFVKSLGENARGTIITQVFPNERSIASPLVKEALTLAREAGLKDVSPAFLEGFAGAKVLVEGLRRAGPNPTRERVREALEAIRGFDIGGMEVNYSPTDHTGLSFVDLSIINKDGKFTR